VAPPPGTLRVGRYFAALIALLALLYLVVFFPGNRHKPKLGIDLVGGIRVVFTAQVPKGSPAPSSGQMSQARQILEDRINTTGVTGATVVVQGSNQLVVEIPNATATDVARLGNAAILNFRGLMAPAAAVGCVAKNAKGASGSPTAGSSSGGSPTSSPSSPAANAGSSSKHSGNDAGHRPLTAPTPSSTPKTSGKAATSSTASTPKASGSGTTSPTASATGTAAPPTCTSDPFAAVVKADPKLRPLLEPDQAKGEAGLNSESCPSPAMPAMKTTGKPAPCNAFSSLTSTQQQEITTALQRFDCASGQDEPDIVTRYYIACDNTGSEVYLLGHVVVRGQDIDSAAAQAPSSNGQGNSVDWTVNLNLTGGGGDKWHAWTSKYNITKFGIDEGTSTDPTQCVAASQPCSLYVGFTLDGAVLSLPRTEAVLDTRTTVSGNFSQSDAKNLAQELNYGKLPISFHPESIRNVSATLGTSQLHGAFLAGGIGLVLVIIYSLIYYRALGLVTIASLVVSALLTYSMLVILASQIGFTLDLAGIAGFIVALGITADSFVVFFERIKDEVHEGRSLRVAVPRAWIRARRTILSADTVSFLAAAILYYFASADVRGFAFTLGMSTILDLVVVFLFTHPIVSLLSRSRAFGSAKFTGLSHVRAGGIATGDDEPVVRRPARTRRNAAAPAAGTVVLEKPEAEDAAEDVPDEAEAPPAEDQPRRRTTPRAGSAAERAAERRARMREQGERGKHERGDA
jgi:preprotein translocase subunit SecD